MNALNQFVTAIQLANSINLIDVCAAVPPTTLPIANTTLEICTSVIEAGKTGIGPVGGPDVSPPNFRTAQLRVDTTSATTIDVNALGLTRLVGSVALPLRLAGGGAEGTLTEIICDRAGGLSTTDTLVAPRPIAATISPGTPLATLQLRLLGGTLANITVRVDPVNGIDISPSLTNHLVDDQMIGDTEQVPGSGLDLGVTIDPSDLQVDVDLLGGAFSTNQITSSVLGIIVPVLNGLLSGLASPAVTDLLDTIGIGVSESDLRLNDVTCGAPLLRG